MKLTSALFKAARTVNDISSIAKVATGDVNHGAKRVKNKLIGRLFGKLGVWR